MIEPSTTERDLIEEMADSFVSRLRAGQRPSIEEYAERYPELAGEVRELLPALVLLEQNASLDDVRSAGGARPAAADIPSEIGDFTIIRELGRGGMGVVYEAVQQSLGRHVALKVLSTPAFLSPTHLERFHLEARAAARLHHTHIVPVFGVGEHQGLHYYAMQFIQGQSLDLVIDALRDLRRHARRDNTVAANHAPTLATAQALLSGFEETSVLETGAPGNGPAAAVRSQPDAQVASAPPISQSDFTAGQSDREFYRSVARVGLQVAEALAYAHGEGILHRDIKPSNLLLDARGHTWVTDFGLAKAEDSDGLTQTGDFVGTLRYMAPERLDGWSDRRSDLYSLGATLYELLTQRTLFQGSTRGGLAEQILYVAPEAPSKVDPRVPRDLETIVLKAIAKEPVERYRTADEMAEDLQRFLADRPIRARRATPWEQFVRWRRRNPVVAALAGAVAALIIAAVVILSVSNARIRRESAARAVALNDKDAALSTAQEAINQMLTRTASDVFADAPRLHPVRVELLEDALRFYEVLASKPGADPMLRQEMARVLHAKAGLERELDRYDEAARSLERCIALAKPLVGLDPNPPEFREGLAIAEQDLGLTWHLDSKPPPDNDRRVEAQYRKALQQFDDLEREWPDRPQPAVLCRRYLANFALRRGENAEAERLWRAAIDRGEAYVARRPAEENEVHEIAWATAGLFDLVSQSADRAVEAEAILQRGLRPVDAQLAEDPDAVQAIDAAAALRLRLALCYCRQNRVDEALPVFERAAGDMQSLCEAFPWNNNYWGNLTWFHEDMAVALRNSGRAEEEKAILRRYRDWLHSIASKIPDEPGPREKLRKAETELSRLLGVAGLERDADELSQSIEARHRVGIESRTPP